MTTTDMAENTVNRAPNSVGDSGSAAVDPMWYKDAIIYQTHVKAFGDSNGDGIGDFRGLTERLDYIQQLGVNTVWILPFYPSPQRDDGYDIAGYTDVHPDYGSMEDCREFIAEAHARDLRVVTELIINHTSDQHPWFQAARRAPRDSEERNFYVWSDDDSVYSQSRIIFTDTETSNWSWDPLAKQYYWHRFFSHQPDLNFDNPKVLEAVLEIMRFWLSLGVDGLRLDAIPYLIEREGTSCENLPETHDVLKKIRAELDAGFPGRMLLAEANQWPEDVREYFAEGDECHMAYHFPVMPRMYMAVAQEDRHPIIDIMGQTPEIPDNCQWAIFLRNHDELTLEMVTDRERDYMYRTYAHDPRMRINVGIRRRLAPLLDNDMGKIKLMNSLLLSLLGTPVLYYGDEIGMGDNIYLGDRNGVRTPMQWSPDRNAGFSRADPQRLYLPPVMDPSYGYEAVNVEAQSRSPGSLLNWMRRMIAVRKQHSAFGRGSTRFLGPANRRILAYLREHALDDGTTNVILCVANLSRSPQPVELNLSEFEGHVPMELTGRTPFPRIGALPYLLTLPGHGFYWFQMTENAEEPAWLSDIAPVQELPLLVMASGLETLLSVDAQGTRRETTDKLQHRLIELLPAFLSGQRWFAAKNEALSRVSLDRLCLWEENDQRWMLAWVGVEFENMPAQQYFLPLSIVWDDAADDLVAAQRGSVLARVRQHARMGVICDAYVDPAFVRALAASMAQQRQVSFDDGELRFWRSADFATRLGIEADSDDVILGTACRELDVEIPTVQGSNSAVILRRPADAVADLTEHTAVTEDVDGGSAPRLFLKSYRRLQEGVNPELEIGRFLTESSSFQNAAPLAGAIEFVDAQANTVGLAIVQGHMPNQGDAWTYTLSYLERLFEDHLAQLARDNTDMASVPEAAVDDGFCELMTTLGQRTAEMHQAFAGASADHADFSPEPISPQNIAAWGDDIARSVHEALDKLQAQQALLAADWSASLNTLLASREAMLARVSAWVDAGVAAPGTSGQKIRHHGDYHLGQVLIDRNDFIIIDFEGEPSRSLAERRSRHSALKDVAGMLRSFDYASATALQRARELWPEAAESFAPVLDDWQQQCNRAFIDGYRKVGAADATLNEALLNLLMMDKALYELRYELDHRPAWVHVPLQGLLRLMDSTDTMV